MNVIDDGQFEENAAFRRVHAPRRSLRDLRSPRLIDGIAYKIARTLPEREAAFRLVHDAYTSGGLMATSPDRMRMDYRHLLPDAPIFIAQSEGKIIYTMSLFPDCGLGLLLERTFCREIAQIRRRGDKLAEVSCLASRRGHFERAKMFDVYVNLVALMFHYARHRGIQRLLIAVHPRHARFYQRMLGFEIFGQRQTYGRVGGRPAVACMHDFERASAKTYPLQARIDQMNFQPWELWHRPMTASERQYFLARSATHHRLLAAA